ncbi:porin [Vibrio sp. PNB22_3_1]
MKKSLTALILASAFSTANANNIYANDTTALALSGEVDAFLRTSEIDVKGVGKSTEDPNVDFFTYVQFDLSHKVNDAVTAVASLEVESNGSGAVFDDVYGGFKGDFGLVTFGESGDSMDLIEVTDISNEGVYIGSPVNPYESVGKGIRYQKTLGGNLDVSVDWQTDADENVDGSIGLAGAYNFGNGSVSGAYSDFGNDASAMGLAATFTGVEALFVGASYSVYEAVNYTITTGSNAQEVQLGAHDGNAIALAAAYSMDEMKFYTTYGLISVDEVMGTSVDAELSSILLGVDYKLSGSVSAFFEYTMLDLSGADIAAETDGYQALAGVNFAF